jgi:DNA-directed RNA polymerase II subunit RPB9
MATPQSTTSAEAPKSNLEQITFRFCSECSNMLYPKEDDDAHKLMFTCRTCQYTEEATSSCVFRHILNNSAGETAGVTQDVGSDPTVCGPVSSRSSDVDNDAAAAAAAADADADASASISANTTLALCLKCGITLLHCRRCHDPASINEYNNYVRSHPDFAVNQSLAYIRLANHWECLDQEARAAFEDRFATTSHLYMPGSSYSGSSEESITQYLPFEGALDPDADPPEALGLEPTVYDWNNSLD